MFVTDIRFRQFSPARFGLRSGMHCRLRFFHSTAPATLIVLALGACSGGGGSTATAPPSIPGLPPPPTGLVSSASAFTADCAGVPNPGTLYANAEVEPHLAINPANLSNLIGTWQQDRWSNGAAQGTAVGFSFDAGTTWTTRPLPASRCGGGNIGNGGDYERATDPWVTISPNGTAYQMSLAISGATLQPGSISAMLVFRSTDGGRTWSNPVTLIRDTDQFFNDKNTITADPTDSRFVYAVWDRLSFDNRGPAFFARTGRTNCSHNCAADRRQALKGTSTSVVSGCARHAATPGNFGSAKMTTGKRRVLRMMASKRWNEATWVPVGRRVPEKRPFKATRSFMAWVHGGRPPGTD